MDTKAWLIFGMVLGIVFCCGIRYAYDQGITSVVRDCNEFATFTSGKQAFLCDRLATMRDVEESRAHPGKPKAGVAKL